MGFHQHRLVSHKNKLEKANIAKSRSKNNVMNTSEKPRLLLRIIVNTNVSRIDILKHQLSELKELICTRFQSDHKHVEKYNSVISEQTAAIPTVAERLSKNNKRKKRRKHIMQRRLITEREKNEKYLKNLSDHTLTDHQVSILRVLVLRLVALAMAFKNVRNLLLINHNDGFIDDDEFVVLYDLSASKNLDFPYDSYAQFDLDELDESESFAVSLWKTRYMKSEGSFANP